MCDESVRARLLDALDDRPAELAEPGLVRQRLLPVGLVAGVADDRAELALQRVALVPPVPEQREPASRADYAVQLGHCLLPVEPVVRLPREGRVHALIRQRDRLGTAFERGDRRHSGPQLVEHRSTRLDGHYFEAERDEAAGQLPRSGADVEDSGAHVEPEQAGRPAQGLFRVLRPVPLVLRGDGLEAAGARRAVRHGSPGRGR